MPLLSNNNETAFGTLVRFKAMIQDMLNPEFFAKNFTIINSVTNETRFCQGKYHSTVINEVSKNNKIPKKNIKKIF